MTCLQRWLQTTTSSFPPAKKMNHITTVQPTHCQMPTATPTPTFKMDSNSHHPQQDTKNGLLVQVARARPLLLPRLRRKKDKQHQTTCQARCSPARPAQPTDQAAENRDGDRRQKQESKKKEPKNLVMTADAEGDCVIQQDCCISSGAVS